MAFIGLGLVFLFIFVSGGLRSVEVGFQNTQKIYVRNVWLCAVFSYAVALAGFSIFLAVSKVVAPSAWPSLDDLRQMPWWAPFGGLIGGVAVVGMITVAKYVGVATFNAVVIVSEMVVALVMDHLGLMGFDTREITLPRLVAVGLITVAVYLMASDSPEQAPASLNTATAEGISR
ncbi:DMT family transporter [Nocardia sp. Marseille-Q1738]